MQQQPEESYAILLRLIEHTRNLTQIHQQELRASQLAIQRSSASSAAVGEAVKVSRTLLAALEGGAGVDKTPDLGDTLLAARRLMEGA